MVGLKTALLIVMFSEIGLAGWKTHWSFEVSAGHPAKSTPHTFVFSKLTNGSMFVVSEQGGTLYSSKDHTIATGYFLVYLGAVTSGVAPVTVYVYRSPGLGLAGGNPHVVGIQFNARPLEKQILSFDLRPKLPAPNESSDQEYTIAMRLEKIVACDDSTTCLAP